MKTITFIRHGNASSSSFLVKDFERSLTEKGIAEAEKMSEVVLQLQIPVQLFICSAARRTLQTCEIFANSYNYESSNIIREQLLYNANAKQVYGYIESIPDEVSHIAIVGHNPTMSECASMLCQPPSFVDMPTCGVFSLSIETTSWNSFLECERKLVYLGKP
jgi:phosphohistidine phosphatase